MAKSEMKNLQSLHILIGEDKGIGWFFSTVPETPEYAVKEKTLGELITNVKETFAYWLDSRVVPHMTEAHNSPLRKVRISLEFFMD